MKTWFTMFCLNLLFGTSVSLLFFTIFGEHFPRKKRFYSNLHEEKKKFHKFPFFSEERGNLSEKNTVWNQPLMFWCEIWKKIWYNPNGFYKTIQQKIGIPFQKSRKIIRFMYMVQVGSRIYMMILSFFTFIFLKSKIWLK